MERMKLTEKEKDQIVKRGAEAMSKIIERMSIEMGELEEENKKLKEYNGELIENHKKDIAILCEENKKLKEENEELDRVNHNLNAKLSDLYDVKQILRDIVINMNRLDKLKKVVFKYDAKPED